MSKPYFSHPSSYRDPSGFVFERDHTIYRQINRIFKDQFDLFTSSGCCEHLQRRELLVGHEVIKENFTESPDHYLTLRPDSIDFISFPYEWSFDMMKDAALLTLTLLKESLAFGIILKDATPYNIQWRRGKLIFIDTLSFEKYDQAKPWIAYRQFCECFLSPLLLMHYTGQPLQPLSLAFPEGIPLPITSSLLPWRSRLSFYTYLHIHLHSAIASKKRPDGAHVQSGFSEKKLRQLTDSLESLVRSLKWKGEPTTWGSYYDEASERGEYLEEKKMLVREWVKEIPEIQLATDLGANEGEFSLLLAEQGIKVIAADSDHTAINNLYNKVKLENEKNILPLLIDLANPSPSIGFGNRERSSFLERIRGDMILALALIHHLSIGKNIPFEKIADLFQRFTNYLIIEFVPKQDPKVQFMLTQKKDIYHAYTEENFLSAFGTFFEIIQKAPVAHSGRTLYLMKKSNA